MNCSEERQLELEKTPTKAEPAKVYPGHSGYSRPQSNPQQRVEPKLLMQAWVEYCAQDHCPKAEWNAAKAHRYKIVNDVVVFH